MSEPKIETNIATGWVWDATMDDAAFGFDVSGHAENPEGEGGLRSADVPAADNPTVDPRLNSAVDALGARLTTIAQENPARLRRLLGAAFGVDLRDPQSAARIDALVARIAGGDGPLGNLALPAIRLVGDVLPEGRWGAYDAGAEGGAGAILLHHDLVGDPSTLPDGAPSLDAVLAEEMGHHFDHVLNGGPGGPGDTPGDEGEAFALLLAGADPNDPAVRATRGEDDWGQLGDGTWVEFSNGETIAANGEDVETSDADGTSADPEDDPDVELIDTVSVEVLEGTTTGANTYVLSAPVYKRDTGGPLSPFRGYFTVDANGNEVPLSVVSPAAAEGRTIDGLRSGAFEAPQIDFYENTHRLRAGAQENRNSPLRDANALIPNARADSTDGAELFHALDNAGFDTDPVTVLTSNDNPEFRRGYEDARDGRIVLNWLEGAQIGLDLFDNVSPLIQASRNRGLVRTQDFDPDVGVKRSRSGGNSDSDYITPDQDIANTPTNFDGDQFDTNGGYITRTNDSGRRSHFSLDLVNGTFGGLSIVDGPPPFVQAAIAGDTPGSKIADAVDWYYRTDDDATNTLGVSREEAEDFIYEMENEPPYAQSPEAQEFYADFQSAVGVAGASVVHAQDANGNYVELSDPQLATILRLQPQVDLSSDQQQRLQEIWVEEFGPDVEYVPYDDQDLADLQALLSPGASASFDTVTDWSAAIGRTLSNMSSGLGGADGIAPELSVTLVRNGDQWQAVPNLAVGEPGSIDTSLNFGGAGQDALGGDEFYVIHTHPVNDGANFAFGLSSGDFSDTRKDYLGLQKPVTIVSVQDNYPDALSFARFDSDSDAPSQFGIIIGNADDFGGSIPDVIQRPSTSDAPHNGVDGLGNDFIQTRDLDGIGKLHVYRRDGSEAVQFFIEPDGTALALEGFDGADQTALSEAAGEILTDLLDPEAVQDALGDIDALNGLINEVEERLEGDLPEIKDDLRDGDQISQHIFLQENGITPDGEYAIASNGTVSGIGLVSFLPEPGEDGVFAVNENGLFENLEDIIPRDDEIITGPFPPEPVSILTPDQQAFAEDYDAFIAAGDTPEVASSKAYANYQIAVLDGEGEGFTNDAYFDGRVSARADDAPPIDDASRPAYNTLYGYYAGLVTEGAAGEPGARATLEAAGVQYNEDGTIDETEGSVVAQISRAAFDMAVDPAIAAAVQGIFDNPELSAAEKDAAISDLVVSGGVPGASGDGNLILGQPREEVYRQLDEAIGNAFDESSENFSPTTGFLLTGVRNIIQFAEDEGLDSAFFADLLDGNSPALTNLLGRIGDGEYAAFGELVPEVAEGLRDAGLDLSETDILSLTGASLGGEAVRLIGLQANDGEGDDALVTSGILAEATSEIWVEAIRGSVRDVPVRDRNGDIVVDEFGEAVTEEVRVDLTVQIGDIVADAGNELLNYFGTKYEEPALIQVGAGGEFGWELFKVLDGRQGGSVNSAVQAGGAFIASFFDEETAADIREGFRVGGQIYALASGSTGIGGAGVVAIDVVELFGVDVSPEVEFAATTIAHLASGPVGWVALGADILGRILSIDTWTVSTPYWVDFDADGDLLMDDDSFIDTDFGTNFFREVHTLGGEIRYEVNGVNPDLLEEATFELKSDPVVGISVSYDSSYGYSAALTVNGERIDGNFRTPSRGRGGGDPTSGTFTSHDGSISVAVDISHSDDGGGTTYRLRDGEADQFAPNYRIEIDADYGDLNPETGPENVSETVGLTREQYDALVVEIGADGPVTLQGDDPLLNAGPGFPPGTPTGSVLAEVMGGLQVDFNSDRRVANIYQYRDVNGDGNVDLMRYGINQGGDGLNAGDERYEITLLDENREPLAIYDADGNRLQNLPTIKTATEEEAVMIGGLTPYLFRWATARPELGAAGRDPVSIYNAVEEAGHLDEMIELRDLDYQASQTAQTLSQFGDADALASDDPDVSQAAANDFAANLTADPETAPLLDIFGGIGDADRIEELRAELGLFDTAAYSAANPEIVHSGSVSGVDLAFHYTALGNSQSLAIDEEGTVLAVGQAPIEPRYTSVGSSFETGDQLLRYEMLVSENGQFAARFTSNGDLIIQDYSSGDGETIWQADIGVDLSDGGSGSDETDAWVEITERGNLVVRDKDGDAVFNTETGTAGAHGHFVLTMSNDGNLNLTDPLDGRVLWAAGAGGFDNEGAGVALDQAGRATVDPAADRSAGSDLEIVATSEIADTVLAPGQAIVSPNLQWALEFTDAGTLRLVDNASGTFELLSDDATLLGSDASVVVGRDGAFEVRDAGDDVVWSAQTETAGVDRPIALRLHNDGGLALVDSQFNRPLWSWDADTIARADPLTEVVGTGLVAGPSGVSTLNRQEAILSEDGTSVLELTATGMLRARDTVSQTETVIVPEGAVTVTIQGNGNLVARDAAGDAIWSSGTAHGPDHTLVNRAFTLEMGEDGNVLLVDPQYDSVLWTAADGLIDRAEPPQTLSGSAQTGGLINPGEGLVSDNGTHILVLETDGKLMLRNTETGEVQEIADAGPDAVLDLQDNGDLVLYTAGREDYVFRSDTNFDEDEGTLRPFTLVVGDDGNIVWQDNETGTALWSLDTGRLRDATLSPQSAFDDLGSVISSNTDTGVPHGDLGVMTPGQRLVSENGDYYALIEGNGNLVVREVGDNGVDIEIFNADAGMDADDIPGGGLYVQWDGNLVIYGADDGVRDPTEVAFASDTHASGVDRPFDLEMGNDGILRLLDPTTNDELWNTAAGKIGRAEQNA
ncbi:MAG: hypothetical protein AAF919_14970 [Pseudomonadota bacterium]